MVLFAFIFIAAILIHLRGLTYAIAVAKNRKVIAMDRFILSMFILVTPLLGILAYHLFKDHLREKEFRFFSDEFVDRIYGQ